ncbi:MAG: SURF1 family protein [Methylococcales bacterium]|nr:SURF1 family protein [Methylococcales bacterium]
MTLTIGKIELKFSVFSIILYLVLVAILISLGFWQLGRAEQKAGFLERERESEKKGLFTLKPDLKVDLSVARYRKIKLTGHYDAKHQYLIDNQIINGQVGYFVMTPFKIKGLNKTVLVNRGWVKLNKDRRVLPDVTIVNLKTTITGRINHFPVVGIRLKGAETPTKNWPSVVQVVNSDVLSEKLAYPLYPFQVELDHSLKDGYIRIWKEKSTMPAEKHTAYAVQWFGLALTLTVLFIGISRTTNDRTI